MSIFTLELDLKDRDGLVAARDALSRILGEDANGAPAAKPSRNKPAKKATPNKEEPAVTPKDMKPAQEEKPEEPQAQEDDLLGDNEPQAQEFSSDDVKAGLKGLIDGGKRDAVAEILKENGATSFSTLEPTKYAAVMTAIGKA